MDAGAVRALSIDLYGRPPLDGERAHWIGRPRAEFIARALASEEAWRHWLDEQLYYFMLIDRFRPVGTSLDELPELLAKRAMPPRDALHRIALSTSFDLRNPGADTFVTVVMEQSEEFGGWAWSWKADLDENTRTDVRGRTWQEGHRVVSEAVADDAKVHVDRFD